MTIKLAMYMFAVFTGVAAADAAAKSAKGWVLPLESLLFDKSWHDLCMLCRYSICRRSSSQEREGVVQAAVSQLVVQLAVAQGNLSRLQLSLDGSRLGGLGLARNGALGFAEVCGGCYTHTRHDVIMNGCCEWLLLSCTTAASW
jgi:hypothetical protein